MFRSYILHLHCLFLTHKFGYESKIQLPLAIIISLSPYKRAILFLLQGNRGTYSTSCSIRNFIGLANRYSRRKETLFCEVIIYIPVTFRRTCMLPFINQWNWWEEALYQFIKRVSRQFSSTNS